MTTSLKALCLGLLSLPFLPTNPLTAAESSTPVIGYYKQTLAAGGNLVTAGFVTKSEFQGQATSQPVIVGNTMTVPQTSASWTADQFNTGTGGASSHYMEILSDGTGSHVGLILDIKSNLTNSLEVEVPNGFVLAGGNPPFQYVIRSHATLSTIFPPGSGLLPYEDLVSVFDEVGTESIFQLNASNNWEDINSSQNADAKVIYPAQGMVVSTGGVRTVTVGGGQLSYVKVTPTRVSAFTAPLGVPNLIGVINPLVGAAPADVSEVSSFGFTGLTDYEDSIAMLSTDGNLDVIGLFSLQGGVLVDENSNPVAPTASIRNGTAVVISLGSNNASLLTQGAPSSSPPP